MMKHARTFLVGMVAVGCVAAQSMAATMDIETFKDNSVYRDNVSGVLDYSGTLGGVLSVDCNNGELTYAAFDLSALPSGAVITGAQVGVFDQRTSNNYTIYVALADVADDWDETTLDWTTAAASYGATTGIEQVGGTQTANTSMIAVSDVLWYGNISMNANPAGQVWSTSRSAANLYTGTDTYHGGVAWTDAELVSALNDVLNGDQVAVFAFSTAYGKNQYFAERRSTDGPGATLRLEYVVPEPASLGLLALGTILVLSRKRD